MFFDPFSNASDSLIAPAKLAFPISPDDVADMSSGTKAIYVGTGGDLVVRLVESDVDTVFANVPDGSILPLRVQAVRQSGTSASNLVGLA